MNGQTPHEAIDETALLPSADSTDDEVVIAACRRAIDPRNAEQRLCWTIEAGRLLRQVPRNPGVRTSLGNLTRWQMVLQEAGISRPTALVWMKASEIDEGVVSRYVVAMRNAGHAITIDGLLQWAKPLGGDDGGDDGGAGAGDDGGAGDGDDEGDDDADRLTHVCAHCGCLVECDRGDG